MFTELPTALDLAAIAAGALFGTALAVSRKVPIAGVFFLAIVAGLGGGILRDLLLNVRIVAMYDRWYIATAVITSIVALPLARRITQHPYIGLILDGLVLGLYVLVGAEKAALIGLPFATVVFIGVITTLGGGMMADIMVGERPVILQPGRWYASAALVGAIFYASLHGQVAEMPLGISTIALIAGIRIVSVRKGFDAPSVEMLQQFRIKR